MSNESSIRAVEEIIKCEEILLANLQKQKPRIDDSIANIEESLENNRKRLAELKGEG